MKCSMKVTFRSKRLGSIFLMSTRLSTRLNGSLPQLWPIWMAMARKRFLWLLMMQKFRFWVTSKFWNISELVPVEYYAYASVLFGVCIIVILEMPARFWMFTSHFLDPDIGYKILISPELLLRMIHIVQTQIELSTQVIVAGGINYHLFAISIL